jgi:hypothetical protein
MRTKETEKESGEPTPSVRQQSDRRRTEGRTRWTYLALRRANGGAEIGLGRHAEDAGRLVALRCVGRNDVITHHDRSDCAAARGGPQPECVVQKHSSGSEYVHIKIPKRVEPGEKGPNDKQTSNSTQPATTTQPTGPRPRPEHHRVAYYVPPSPTDSTMHPASWPRMDGKSPSGS